VKPGLVVVTTVTGERHTIISDWPVEMFDAMLRQGENIVATTLDRTRMLFLAGSIASVETANPIPDIVAETK